MQEGMREMSHSHTEDRTGYITEQICTLVICALLGGVSVMLYWQNLLRFILAPKFFLPVFWGGIALLVLVFLRAITLLASRAAGADAEHCEHNHDCACDHHHEHVHEIDALELVGAHSHEHSHEHSPSYSTS
jgi:hypothetical protein